MCGLTRNRLQRFVNDARRGLEEEFTRQLQNDYGLDPNSGAVTPLDNLRHLNDAQRETARILRDTLAHYRASENADEKAGLDRIVREQAFTVLNRLAALRMAEARGLMIESVGNGYQAKGFQLYARLAGTGLGETGDAYRVYLFSVFDELARDLPGLFDRYSPQGRLFPREAALLQALVLINDAEIEPLWAEDETIGWIYQYFNSKEERKAMRDASQAPRNSRELAVRNQFFTPRYVVEFLVDNTLGRLWFNATGGKTGLRDRCQYLLVKPDEAPQAAAKLRDPRTLKLLDPACGSMHFGLYAFDLLIEICREAWAWEQQQGPGSLDVSTQPKAGFKPLCQTYADMATFLRDVPRLIVEHNIYGVDIDPRAAQIASSALWLRAQRAWHDDGIKARDRPPIGQGHVLAAVAPPAERDLRVQFAASLDKQDADLFEKALVKLKGLPELGILLKVERELPHLVRQVYGGKGTGLFADQDRENWSQAESRLRGALTSFAYAAQSTYQGRLFAQDALRGFRLIDLCGERFDVVLMNPPFGLSSKEYQTYVEENYPDGYVDIYACFVSRAIELCYGWVGAITSRSLLITKKLERLRSNALLPRIEALLDLGWPVMDGATVQSAAYTINCSKFGSSSDFLAIDCRATLEKERTLVGAINHREGAAEIRSIARSAIENYPRQKILYSLPVAVSAIFSTKRYLKPEVLAVKKGMTTFSDYRFLRLRWECQYTNIGRGKKWAPLAKGGAFARFYSNLPVLVNWGRDGEEVSEVNRSVNGQTAQARQASSFYYLAGGTYSRRSKDFGVRVLPEGFILGDKGPAVFSSGKYDPLFAIGLLNSRLINCLVNLQANAKQYDPGIVESVPFAEVPDTFQIKIVAAVDKTVRQKWLLHASYEVDTLFSGLPVESTLSGINSALGRLLDSAAVTEASAVDVINDVVDECYGVDSTVLPELIAGDSEDDVEGDTDDEELELNDGLTLSDTARRVSSYVLGIMFGRWHYPIPAASMLDFANGSILKELPRAQPALNTASRPRAIIEFDGLNPFRFLDHFRAALSSVWGSHAEFIEQEIEKALNCRSVNEFFSRPSGFFSYHLNIYTESRRQAPIYWPLSTASGEYIIWIYYPTADSQTLYTAINDYIGPRLEQLSSEMENLRSIGPARTRGDEKRLEALHSFEVELIEMRDSLLNLAPAYKPNYDDGVQISAAPLWPHFRHKPWQKVLKDTWAKLERGDYDWARLAMNYWPDRVHAKCKTDKSLAIAHGLEHLYVEPEAEAKKTRGRKKAGGVE